MNFFFLYLNFNRNFSKGAAMGTEPGGFPPGIGGGEIGNFGFWRKFGGVF